MTPPVQPNPPPAEDRRHSSKVTRAMYRVRHRATEHRLSLAIDAGRGIVGCLGAAYFMRHLVVDLGATGEKEASTPHFIIIGLVILFCLAIAFGKSVWKTLAAIAAPIKAWKSGGSQP
jgi:hypothetical protein